MPGPETRPPIRIEPVTAEARRLWQLALELATDLGSDSEWSLIGGLMVQLHGFEQEDDLRPTTDIDLLGGARKPPAMTEKIATLLVDKGGEMAMPPRSNPGVGYRFELNGEVVEILGPDGLRQPPKTLGALKTFGVSGGSQALGRTEVVQVSLEDDPAVAVRRPNLLGAILIKARVVDKNRRDKFQSDRLDLIRLLSYVQDPRALAQDQELRSSEKKWLRNVERSLDLNDAALEAALSPEALERAQQTLRLLSMPSS